MLRLAGACPPQPPCHPSPDLRAIGSPGEAYDSTGWEAHAWQEKSAVRTVDQVGGHDLPAGLGFGMGKDLREVCGPERGSVAAHGVVQSSQRRALVHRRPRRTTSTHAMEGAATSASNR